MTEYTVDMINSEALADPHGFVRRCEEEYLRSVEAAVDAVLREDRRIVLLAGPSSSGKTTTAQLIADIIRKRGGTAQTVSLDNFYIDSLEKYPRDENGAYDFETVEALDLPLLDRCFSELLSTGECDMPVFDFSARSRSLKTCAASIKNGGVLVVEGLHALNCAITGKLPPQRLAKLYVSVSSRIYDGGSEPVLNKRTLRLVRRLVRDSRFRSTSASETFALWSSVLAGEDKYLFPFRELAHKKINSFHACEPCLLAGAAIKLLDETEGSEFHEGALALKRILERFVPIEPAALGRASLLREFIG